MAGAPKVTIYINCKYQRSFYNPENEGSSINKSPYIRKDSTQNKEQLPKFAVMPQNLFCKFYLNSKPLMLKNQ